MAKHDAKGRSKGDGSFVMVFNHMLNTPAGLSLSPHEMAVLIRVMQFYKGENNGKIFLSARHAGKLANMNKNTAAKVLTALVDKGFLEVITPGGFSTNGGKATCYEITCYPARKGKPAKNTFQSWRPFDDKNIVVLKQGRSSMKSRPPCMKLGPT